MSRAGRWIVVAVAALVGAGCHEELKTCSTDADCDPGASCMYEFCVGKAASVGAQSQPRVIVTADRKEVFVGEPVRVDASASSGVGELEFTFRVEPEGAASLDLDGAAATVRPEIAHQDVEVVVEVRAEDGGTAEGRVQIAARNAEPSVRLEATPDPFQPGDTVKLVATGTDADGDSLTWEWYAEGAFGVLEPDGSEATLSTVTGMDAVTYPVRVVADDGHGGRIEAKLVLQPRNAAPKLEVRESAADHRCSGTPLRCNAVVVLPIEAEDSGVVDISLRLVSDRQDVEHDFGSTPVGDRTLELSCAPACPLAGEWMVEVTATDSLGASATRQLPITVRNRPPIVRAHDGSALPHVALSISAGGGFRVVREAGAVAVYEDPDGDPLAVGSVLWSSESPVVSFTNPGDVDTEISAVGSVEELSSLQVAVFVADVNGAEAANVATLPVSNRPPSISWTGDSRQGHSYSLTEADGTRIYRKDISLLDLVSSDPEGDPIAISFELEPVAGLNDETAVTIVEDNGRFFLEGRGEGFVGRSYNVTARATDPWGATATAPASVVVTNRLPGIVSGGVTGFFNTGRQCEQHSCCIDDHFGGCVARPSSRVATRWGSTTGPLVATTTLGLQDPDGDPLELQIEFAHATDTVPSVLTATGWRSSGTVACTWNGSSWSCPVSVKLEGRAEWAGSGAACAVSEGTVVGASVEVIARALDGLGGVSAEKRWTWSTVDDPADGSCP